MTESTIFVGREREREDIRKLIVGRDRSVICVRGRSAMGKTYLLRQIRDELAEEADLYSSFYQFVSRIDDPIYPFVSALGEMARNARKREGAIEKTKRFWEALKSEPEKTAKLIAGAAFKDARTTILKWLDKYIHVEESVKNIASIAEEKAREASKDAELEGLLAEVKPAVISVYLDILENLSEYGDPEARYVFMFDQIEHAPEGALEFLMTLVRVIPQRCYLLFSLNTELPRGGDIWNDKQSELSAHGVEVLEVEPFGQAEIRALIQARGKVVPALNLLREAERATGGRPLPLDDWIQSDDFEKGIVGQDEKFQGYQLQRVDACSPEAKKMARALSLVPRPLPRGIGDCATIFDVSAYEVEEQFKELVSQHLFSQTGGEYWFVHEEVQETILNEMDEAVSRDLAGQLIEGIKTIDSEVMEEKDSPYGPTAAVLLSFTDKYEEIYKLNFHWGNFFYYKSEFVSTWEYYQRALKAAEILGDKEKQSSPLNVLGLISNLWGKPEDALKYHERVLSISREVGDRAGEATTLNNIGHLYCTLCQNEDALNHYKQALSIFREVGDRAGEAATLNNMGGVHSALGQKDEALIYYNQALPIRREVGDRAGEATTLNNIGRVYDDLGQKDEALNYYNQALPIHREVRNRAGEATTLNNMGLVYSAFGQKDEALNYYNQALSISREVGDRAGEATTLNNIGRIYDDLGRKDEALNYYNQALSICREVGDRVHEAGNLNNIGRVLSDLSRKDEALNYYNQALSICREVGERYGEMVILNNIAFIHAEKGELAEAVSLMEVVVAIDEEIKSPYLEEHRASLEDMRQRLREK